MKQGQRLSYRQRQALSSLAMANLNRQKPGDEKYRGAVKETNEECFQRLRREELAANGDISPLQKAIEDTNGTTAQKAALRKIWACPSDKLQSMAENPRMRLEMIDPGTRWPMSSTLVEMTEENAEKISGHAKDFFDSKNLSDDNRNRIVLYVGINSEANSFIDPCNPEIWQIAYARLIELGALTGESQAPQAQPTQNIDSLSADELKAVAAEEWVGYILFPQWEKQLLTDYGVRLTDRLRRMVCDEFVRMNLSPHVHSSFDRIRCSMVSRETFPLASNGQPCLSVDERMAQATENYNFSDPRQRAAWAHEIGRLRAALPLPEPTQAEQQ